MGATSQSSPAQPLIHAAMAAIMRDCVPIAKGQVNQAQRFKFRGIDDVYNALHGTFAEHGVFVLPEVLDHRVEERQTKGNGIAWAHFTKVRFRFMAGDGSFIELITIGEAADSGDKGASKSLSIALKYALIQCLLIPTEGENDPDGNTHRFERLGSTPPPSQGNTLANASSAHSTPPPPASAAPAASAPKPAKDIAWHEWMVTFGNAQTKGKRLGDIARSADGPGLVDKLHEHMLNKFDPNSPHAEDAKRYISYAQAAIDWIRRGSDLSEIDDNIPF